MLFPGAPGQQHQNGEDLQTACQHGTGEHKLAEITVLTEVAGRTYSLDAGADVIEGTQSGGEIGSHGEAIQGYQRKHHKQDDHIGGKVGIGVGKDLFVHGLTVVADDLYLPGIEHLTDVSAQTLDEQKQPGDLQAAAGRACAGAHHHQTQKDGLGKAWP